MENPFKYERTPYGGEHYLSKTRGLLKEVALSPVILVKKTLNEIQDRKGRFHLKLAAGVPFALLLLTLSQASCSSRQQPELTVLQTAVAEQKLDSSVTSSYTENSVVDVSESPVIVNTWYSHGEIPRKYGITSWWYQGEITVLPLNDFRPSIMPNDGNFRAVREPGNLINWEDVLEINGTSIHDAKLLRIKNPIITLWVSGENKYNNEILEFLAPKNNIPSRKRYNNLLELRAVMKGESGQLERRFIYLPVDTSEGLPFVQGFVHENRSVRVFRGEDNEYYHYAMIGENDLGKIPANVIGGVTSQY